MDHQKYNQRRGEIIRAYRLKKLWQVLAIFATAALLIVTTCLLDEFINIAVRLVVCTMLIIFSIIFARIRIVTIEHAKQTKLQFLEQDEPSFYANFK